MLDIIRGAQRVARQRSTTYGEVPAEIQARGMQAPELTEIVNTPAKKFERKAEKKTLVRPGLIDVANL
jgi:hypothetical protein